jgi:hypothetical protein
MNINRTNIVRGIIAGFVATIVLSIVMMIKKTMGVMPALDPIHMLTDLATQYLGITAGPAVGWVMHFVLGSVAWGVGLVVLNKHLPGSNQVIKGNALAFVAWLLMMVILMPISGSGFFGLGISPVVPVMTLVLHIIFGTALGISYGALNRNQ